MITDLLSHRYHTLQVGGLGQTGEYITKRVPHPPSLNLVKVFLSIFHFLCHTTLLTGVVILYNNLMLVLVAGVTNSSQLISPCSPIAILCPWQLDRTSITLCFKHSTVFYKNMHSVTLILLC